MESLTPYFVKQVDESDVGYSLHFKGDKARFMRNCIPDYISVFRTRPMQSGSSNSKSMQA